MRIPYLLFILCFVLTGCAKEQFRGDDGDVLVESFLNPPPAQRINSTVLNTDNLPIADDEVHDYLRQVRVVFLNHQGDWPAVRQQVSGVITQLLEDQEVSSASRANQLHIIGFKCYNEYLKLNGNLAGAEDFSVSMFRPLLSTKCVDYGMLSYYLALAEDQLTPVETEQGITYIENGISGILRAGQPGELDGSRARILYGSAVEARDILTRLKKSKR